jgi:hypothetical protein
MVIMNNHFKFLVRHTELKKFARVKDFQHDSQNMVRVYPYDPYSIALQIRAPNGYAHARLEEQDVDTLIAALEAAIKTKRGMAETRLQQNPSDEFKAKVE